MALTAQFPGWCFTCKGKIAVGESFNWGKERGQRVHAHCPTNGAIVASTLPVANGLVNAKIFTWSPLQEQVFVAVVERSGNYIVVAVAGSGKSTTIIEAAKRYAKAYPDRSIAMVAFGSKNGKELEEKTSDTPQIDAGTSHHFWKRVVEEYVGHRYTGDAQINRFKVDQIGRDMVRDGVIDRETARVYLKGAVKLCKQAKGAGVGVPGIIADTQAVWHWLLQRFEIEFDADDPHPGIKIARELLRRSNEELNVIDFDDMLYWPALWGLNGPTYDIVFIDEAQDYNAIQRFLTHRMIGTNGRLIAVGDPYQAIFGFRGADFDSLDRIKAEFDCATLELTFSYRCPQAIVRWAQEVVPHIQANPEAKEGSVIDLDSWRIKDFRGGDYVICRLNAPLIKLAYKMIIARQPCIVLGSEIGEGLVSLIERQKAVDLLDLQERLDAYRREEIKKLERKGDEAAIERLLDKLECIDLIISGLSAADRTIEALTSEIRALFDDRVRSSQTTLMTAHKAKGLESERIFILDPGLMPSPRAKTDEQMQQERNLLYVARTRSKDAAYTIHSADIR